MTDIKIRYKQGRIAYSGSLTPVVAFEESKDTNDRKGYLLWDTKTGASRFRPVDNPYKYATVRVKSLDELKDTCDGGDYDRLTSFNVVVPDTLDLASRRSLVLYLIDRYGLIFKPRVLGDSSEASAFHAVSGINESLNIADYDSQISLIDRWLTENGHGDEYKQKCIDVHGLISSELNIKKRSGGEWYPESLSWSGFGPYGTGNTINFDGLGGLIGIFAPNQFGKSTIIDAMVYSVFGKPKKDVALDEFVGHASQSGESEVVVNHSGDRYRIIRQIGKKAGGGTTGKVNFEKRVGSEWQSLNGHDANVTKAMIAELFGDRADLLYTAISSRDTIQGLIGVGSADRLKGLYRFLNIDLFSKFNDRCKEIIKDIETEIRILGKDADADTYHSLVQQRSSFLDLVAASDQDLQDSQAEYKELIKSCLNLEEEIWRMENDLSEFFDLSVEKEALNKRMATSNAQIGPERKLLESDMKRLQGLVAKLKEITTTGDIGTLKTSIDVFADKDVGRVKLQSRRNANEDELTRANRDVAILNKHPWFETSPYCKQCDFLQNAWDAKDSIVQIEQNSRAVDELIAEVEAEIAHLPFSQKNIKTVQSLVRDIEFTSSLVGAKKLKIAELDSKLQIDVARAAHIDETVAKYSSADVQHTAELHARLADNRSEENALKAGIESLERKHYKLQSDLAKCDGLLASIEQRIRKVGELEETLKFHRTYLQMTSKSGIPLMIISRLLPVMNAEVNRILNETQPWSIDLRIDQDELNVYLIKDDSVRSVNTASDSEMIITSIAFRAALLRISQVAKPCFFVVDEGFGALDSDNIINIKNFIDDIKRHFKFIMIVSHVAQMHDIVDHKIVITRDEDGNSNCVA